MILHLLKVVWHRKRSNALVMAEIFVSFLIVFAVVTLATVMLQRWSAPLGFDWHNVWMIEIDEVVAPQQNGIGALQRVALTASRVIGDLETFPEVEAAATDAMAPYSNNQWQGFISVAGRSVYVHADRASDHFADVMRLPVVKGRWFSREDDAYSETPIVIDAHAASAMFGDNDPIGRKFPAGDFLPDANATFRVVGVIAPYRGDGDLSETNANTMFVRTRLITPEEVHTLDGKDLPDMNRIVFRVRPGTPRSFEAQLDQRLRNAVGATFRIQRMEDMRDSSLKMRYMPLIVLTMVALFLIAMVALGLTGVLWQTVTRRMREIGLRRAVGASGRGIRLQVLGELALLVTLSVAAGTIVIVQLPILGAFRIVSPSQFSSGFLAALAVIYAITLLCGAYPSWLASTIDPAEALRCE